MPSLKTNFSFLARMSKCKAVAGVGCKVGVGLKWAARAGTPWPFVSPHSSFRSDIEIEAFTGAIFGTAQPADSF